MRACWRPYLRVAAAVAAVAIALLPPPVGAQFDAFEAAIARFDAEVAQSVAEDAGGCVSVAVFIGDEVVWAKGWGWADIERRVPASAETIGRIGSISKSVTAVAMMQLVERGVFELDDPVAAYFPEIERLGTAPHAEVADYIERARRRRRGATGSADEESELRPLSYADVEPVTFRMLASHTAGLIREPWLEGAASGSIYRWEDKVLESIPRTFFQTPPRREYSYSNIGFGILGLAISRAAGVPFMELVERQIFGPLGMTSSTFILDTPELWSRMSVGYRRDRDSGRVSAEAATLEHFGRGYKVPNGGVYSTVGDLARFAAAMMGEAPVEILSAASRDEMLRPQAPAEGYGLGFTVRRQDGLHVVGHGGSVAGYNASLSFELGSKLGVAMLRTTSYNPPTSDLLRDLVAAVQQPAGQP